MFTSSIYRAQLAVSLALLCTAGLLAQTTTTNNKKPAPAPAPAKPAATPAKPTAPASKPTNGSGATTNRSATTSTAHAGPTANGTATTHASPTANAPNTARPSTTGSARPGVAGTHPAPTAHPTIDHGRPLPAAVHAKELKGGNEIARRPGGGIRDVHDAGRGMDIHHGLNGGRRISVMRADHSRLVAERGRPGFIERPYAFHGHDFARRTFYDRGRVYDRFYRDAYFHGVAIHVYAPARYYSAGFYGWAYHPWGVPVVYAWGWGSSPWVGYYGYYYAPFQVYPSPSYWLTDYMIASDLQAAYEAGQASGAMQAQALSAANAPPMLTPEVKGEIAQEVQNQIALENAEAAQNAQNQDIDPASSGVARMLGDGRAHIFVAGSALDVVDASGAECALSDGDALQLALPLPPDATSATLVVLASKGGNECARSATITVALDDLQEMQNHMRDTIDLGMEQLQQRQGKSGIPAAPPSAVAPSTNSPFAISAPPPDPNGATEISQQEKDADKSEQDVTAQEKREVGGSASVNINPRPATPN